MEKCNGQEEQRQGWQSENNMQSKAQQERNINQSLETPLCPPFFS